MLTQFSPKFEPAISSPRKACPMCEPKWSTPGTARICRLALVMLRTCSGSEVPGFVIQCMRNPRSLKVGKRSWPSPGSTASPASPTIPTVRYAARGLRTTRARSPPYTSFSERTIAGSARFSEALFSRSRARAGVSVSAITIDASTAIEYEIASGPKNEPDSPPTNTTGSTATTLMRVA